jgi:hypothetical protein
MDEGARSTKDLRVDAINHRWRQEGGGIVSENRDLTRQELCVKLRISESTVRRLEARGLPVVQYEWMRSKRYNLVAVSRWMRANQITPTIQSGALLRNYYAANVRAKAVSRMPAWSDKKAMRSIYEEARRLTISTGVVHQVDHILPLCGALVSGLHVAENLQILTASENMSKHNRFEVEP